MSCLATDFVPSNDPGTVLMLRVQRDEAGAFVELADLFQPRVFALLFRLLADYHLAEDLTQEVFLRLYQGRKRYEPRAEFTAYLWQIARNLARNALRSKRRIDRMQVVRLDQAEAAHPHRFGAADAPAPMELLETAQRVRRGLDALAGRHRRALELQHFDGFSYPEVGRALDLSAKAAKCLLYRARMELRHKLAHFVSEA